uniref:NADH-ubiquinone oxidoreductase chain 4 n=1 Tax=Aeluroscalabotes felinus TaxID=96749 RepID=A0A1Y1CCY8_AELFE|nr:NADH dehydrogenase subunit 4 [Aeluroscalabotes felinus]BAX77932.1 NADH dehydrogenase subunit 4 [Aeluroscalabotes felinus]
MLKLLLPMLMLPPTILTMKKSMLFTTFTCYTTLTALMTVHYLNNPINLPAWKVCPLLGLDHVSTPLLILSTWIPPLMAVANQQNMQMNSSNQQRLFLLTCSLLQITLIMAFSVTNLIFFYIMFESTLIPTLILITRWGSQMERLTAGMYFLFYTLFGSLPLLIALLWMESHTNNIMMLFPLLMEMTNSSMLTSPFLWLACLFAFLIKMPLYGLHLWLPKAHVEAPIAGSMVLAAILLKLGGYGIIRIMPVLTSVMEVMTLPLMVLALWGMIMTSLICLRQTDLKAIIAYSSVSHMALVVAATLIKTPWSISGALILMIAHGLSSSLLFCLANTNYERTHTRTLLLVRGLQNILPFMTFWWLMASLTNMALPPTINIIGELMIISSLFNWASMTLLLTGLATLLTGIYTLYIFLTMQQGKLTLNLACNPSYTREHLLMTLHLLPLILLMLNPKLLT